MYIAARIVGIGCYLLLLVSMLYLIRHSSQKRMRSIYIVLLIGLCLMGAFYEPAPEADLFRIRIYADHFSHLSWPDFLHSLNAGTIGLSSTPSAAIFYKIAADIDLPELIPLISCLIIFGTIFLVMFHTQKRFALSNAAVAMTLFWLLSADFYMPTIATVRSYLASGLILLCIYREAKNETIDLWNIFLYVTAITMHSIGLTLVAIRATAYVFQKNAKRWFRVLYIFILLFAMIKYRMYIFSSINYALGYISSKNAYTYIWEQIILFLSLIVPYLAMHKIKHAGIANDPFLAPFISISRITLLLSILLCWQFTIFQRLEFFAAIVNIPLILYANKDAAGNGKWSVNTCSVTAVLMLVLTLSRGYLCSLKFW